MIQANRNHSRTVKYHIGTLKLCYIIGLYRIALNLLLKGADYIKAIVFFPLGPVLFIGRTRA